MACLITSGRIEPCKDSLGGLRNVYFINDDLVTNEIVFFNPFLPGDTVITNEVYYVENVASIYKFELKSNENVFDQEIVSSRENGTTFFRQTLTIKLKKQDIATHNAVKTLAYAKPRILVENNEGQFFLVGMYRGADLTAGSINNGGALSDFSGYSLTFTAEELLPSPFVMNGTDTFRVGQAFNIPLSAASTIVTS
jgi:hypothetical protein